MRMATAAWIVLSAQVAAIVVFFSGFILPRSVCKDVATGSSDAQEMKTWYNRQDAKILVFIIDALRYDMVVGQDALFPSLKAKGWLLKAEAPTTTSQRLKAMTTGGIPAFIEVAKAFDSDEVLQDNLLKQLLSNGKSAAVLGDDTWLALYPEKYWDYVAVFPSFNVWDLDTVDRGIEASIDAIFDNTGGLQHDFTVVHFLGVDHAGHRYGPRHPEMKRKGKEVNAVIDRVTDTLRKRECATELCPGAHFFVLGDHGMTDDGQHGGGTELEVTSILHYELVSPFADGDVDETFRERFEVIDQKDLTPLWAVLLGVPIPHGNLGIVNRHILNKTCGGDCWGKDTNERIRYITSLSHNVRQMLQGLSGSPEIDVRHLANDFNMMQGKISRYKRHALSAGVRWAEPSAKDLSDATAGNRTLDKLSQVTLRLTGESLIQELERLAFTIRSESQKQWSRMVPERLYCGAFLSFCAVVVAGYDAHRAAKAITRYSTSAPSVQVDVLGPFLVVVHAMALFSNSYVVAEESVVRFLFASLLLFHAARQRSFRLIVVCCISRCLLQLLDRRPKRQFGSHVLLPPLGDTIPVHDLATVPDFVFLVGLPLALMAAGSFLMSGSRARTEGVGCVSGLNSSAIQLGHCPTPQGIILLIVAADGFFKAVTPRSISQWVALVCVSACILLLLKARSVGNARLCLWALACLLTGPRATWLWVLVFAGIQSIDMEGIHDRSPQAERRTCELRFSSTEHAVAMSLFAWLVFFASGHQTVLSGVDFESAFVGFDVLHHMVQGVLMVGFNTFAAFIIPAGRPRGTLICFAVLLTAALFSTALHREHLMVWEVFAPRMLFACVITLVSTTAVLIADLVECSKNRRLVMNDLRSRAPSL
ncbi:hypothetical protein DIPPA_55270 [Diplonema papillatum]|nr:hypothetical protein DIPPA_55270 [Diplonema papillatum]